jgi:Tfp pilus assembly protein PilN
MVFARNSVGIAAGEKDLSLAVARSTFGRLQLRAVHRIADFVILNDDDRKKAIQALFKKNRIPASHIYLTLPRDQGILRQIELPAQLGRKLAEVVGMQVEALSPWPAAEIYWDFATESLKKGMKTMTVTIVIIPRATLDPWIVLFKSAGIPLSGATLSALAHGHGTQVLWKEGPTIVLHRQRSYTEGSFINGSRVVALTVPSTEIELAPRLLTDRLLSAAKQPTSEGVRLIVCGDLEEPLTEDNPRLPVERAKADAARDFGPIAAALLPLKQSAFKSNAVPPELRHRESRRRLIPAFALAFLSICMGAALLAREPYQSSIYASQLDRQIRQIAPTVKEVNQQEQELNRLSERYRALIAQFQNHDYVLETLGELARVLPPSAFLASYSYQDGTITVSGFAQSASEIQNLLESSPVFKGVEFTTGVIRDNSGKDRFTLKMVLEGPK